MVNNDYEEFKLKIFLLVYNTHMSREEKAKEVVSRLKKIYPNPKTALNYTNPFELLIATILSAQANDKTVNAVTPELFKKYKTPKSLAEADFDEVNELIRKITFHNNKTKSIISASKVIAEKHGGKVPESMEELDALPGVARKTANVVLGQVYGKAEGIVVDTHVRRLSNKLGLTDKKDPEKIEKDLMEILPKKDWIYFSSALILYGRESSPARGKGKKEDVLLDIYNS